MKLMILKPMSLDTHLTYVGGEGEGGPTREDEVRDVIFANS